MEALTAFKNLVIPVLKLVLFCMQPLTLALNLTLKSKISLPQKFLLAYCCV